MNLLLLEISKLSGTIQSAVNVLGSEVIVDGGALQRLSCSAEVVLS